MRMKGGAVLKVTGTYAAASRWTPGACRHTLLIETKQALLLCRHRLLLGPSLPDRAPRQGQETEQADFTCLAVCGVATTRVFECRSRTAAMFV